MEPDNNTNATILSTIFNFELPENYTKEDIEYAQLTYLAGGHFDFTTLVRSYSLAPKVVVETLAMLYDNPELAGMSCFPLSGLSGFVNDGDFEKIALVQQLCELREGIFVSVLYAVSHMAQETPEKYLSNVSVVLGFKNCWKFLENRKLWGLERSRVGVALLVDSNILFSVKYRNEDITKTDTGVIPATYRLPFFLDSAFSLISGFDGETPIDSEKAVKIKGILTQVYETILPLLSNVKIKSNFCDLIKNVYAQERTKLSFKADENCGDSFCYTLCAVLIMVAQDSFNDSFIYKIDDKKFLTFCFFYIPRMMEISLKRVSYDLRSGFNQDNSRILLSLVDRMFQMYSNFVYSLIAERKREVFNILVEKCKTDPNCAQLGIETVEDVEEYPGIIPISIDNAKAELTRDILADHELITTILTIQSTFFSRNISESAITLLSCLLGYKNPFKRLVLEVLASSKLKVSNLMVKRLVMHYSEKAEDSNVDRFYIHDILRGMEIEPTKDALRMMSLAIGYFEELLSQIFNDITAITNYRDREAVLKRAFEENDEGFSISEEEIQIELYPPQFIDSLAFLSDTELMNYVKRRIGSAAEAEKVFKEIKAQMKIKGQPFKIKLYKKILANTQKIKREEKMLTGRSAHLANMLQFLHNFSRTNKKLFLNKNVFFRLFSIINSALNLLVGEPSQKIRLVNKQEYKFNPKEILTMVLKIILHMLGNNEKLIQTSGIDKKLLGQALDLASRKFLLNEEQVGILKSVLSLAPEKAKETFIDDDVPDEFLDPLTFMIMENPVLMRTSKITIDRSTFNQIMLNDQIDPFSRLPLDESKITENVELKEKIEEYLSKKGS